MAVRNAHVALGEGLLAAKRSTQLRLRQTNSRELALLTEAAVTCRVSDISVSWAKSGTAWPVPGARQKLPLAPKHFPAQAPSCPIPALTIQMGKGKSGRPKETLFVSISASPGDRIPRTVGSFFKQCMEPATLHLAREPFPDRARWLFRDGPQTPSPLTPSEFRPVRALVRKRQGSSSLDEARRPLRGQAVGCRRSMRTGRAMLWSSFGRLARLRMIKDGTLEEAH